MANLQHQGLCLLVLNSVNPAHHHLETQELTSIHMPELTVAEASPDLASGSIIVSVKDGFQLICFS